MTLAHVLGFVEGAGGLLMVWSFLSTTGGWGYRTPQARWATLRRFIYGCISIALLGLGTEELSASAAVLAPQQFAYQLTLLIGVLIFPVMRAFNLITQDTFRSSDAAGPEPRRRPS